MLVRALAAGPPHRHSTALPRTGLRAAEQPHPLLTDFVCGLLVVGRNSGLERVETQK